MVFAADALNVLPVSLGVHQFCASRPNSFQVPDDGGACQLDAHDETQRQSLAPVCPEPGPQPGCGPCPLAAILRSDGALPQTRAER